MARTIALNIGGAFLILAAACLLKGCGDYQWDERSGRYRSTSEMSAERQRADRARDCRIYRLETGRECIP